MHFARPGNTRRNVALLLRFLLLLFLIVVAFSIGFHVLKLYEGEDYSWFTGVYWALTVMSTLGFGDITFSTDLGRLFSLIVLLTGMVFLLVLMPFTFIEFFYSPWMQAQREARAPKQVPSTLTGHVIIANLDTVSAALIRKLQKYRYPYILAVAEIEDALRFHDEGIAVVRVDLSDPDAFERLGLERASMLTTTADDITNTNVAFTARSLAPDLLIVATSSTKDSMDVLELAGCTQVLQLGEMLGSSLARRTIGGDAQAHLIGHIDQIRIAEATAAGTPLVGKTLRESKLRQRTGLTVIGMWDRGEFRVPGPEDSINKSAVLVLAGTDEQINRYNELLCIYHQSKAGVIIVGGGRVGRAASKALEELEIESTIIDKNPEKNSGGNFLHGSAADLETLEKAGIWEAPAILITTREDDVNIYLTIYCRKLRPDIQIIARASLETNAGRLHRAGADFVMSYGSMGANALFNLLRKGDILLVAEGLNVFRMPVPAKLQGKVLAQSGLRENSGCSLIALQRDGETLMSPPPETIFRKNDELVLIGIVDAEDRFLRSFC